MSDKKGFRSDLKIIVIGTSGTGKTSFVNKWTKNIFSETYKATIVSEFGFKIFEYEQKLYRIQLWDLAGQDKNAMITKIFAKDAHGVIVLCDATNRLTREETTKWKNSVDECATFLDGGRIPCILVENKIDLLSDNSDDGDLTQFSEKNDFIGCFRASAKTGENINESMEFLIKNIIKRMEEMNKEGNEQGKEDVFDKNKRTSVRLETNKHTNVMKKKKDGCC
jgi:small GTP-binding protein